MQLTIVLVFALTIFGVQSGCFHNYDPWGWLYSTNHRNYHCVQQEQCFDNQYNLTPKQNRVTQNGRCISRGTFVFGQVCCLHKSPPPRKSSNFHIRTPTQTLPSRPMTIFSKNKGKQPKPGQPSPTQITPQAPIRSQSPNSSQISPSQNANCKCIQKNRCLHRQVDNFQFTQVICPNHNEICCHNIFQPLSSSSNNQSPQPRPHSPSLPSTQMPTRVQAFRPTAQDPSQISSQVTISTMAPRPKPPNPSLPTIAPSFRPTVQGPSQISSQVMISNMAPHPRPQKLPEKFPLNTGCTCTPFFRCYDEETSSNLTGVVDDRTFTQQRSCPSPNEICCHNLVPPSSAPITNSSPQSQAQPQGLTKISPSTNNNCHCIPTNECHDDDISSNPAGLIDGQNNNKPLRQESCPNANHVCCHHLVHPLPTPIRSPSPQLQTQKPFQVSPQRPTVNPTPQLQSQKPFQVSPQRPTVSPSPRPQSQSPSQIPSPPNSNCLCTPFYKCYDDETSSNLTGVVDDRSFVPVAEQITCSDPNEICCHNLVKPPTVSNSEDCSGSCVPIQECPNLTNILNEARSGKSDAIKELRNLVCSIRGERALVCCQKKGVDNTSGIKFPDN